MKVDKVIFIALAMVVIIANQGFASTQANATDSYKYVIDLIPSEPLHALCIASKPELNQYKLYTIRRESPALIDYRIRLGFFETRAQARNVLGRLEQYQISGTIDTVKKDESGIVALWKQQLVIAAEETAPVLKEEPVLAEALMKIADQAMQDKQYVKAIGLYTKIVNTEHNSLQQIAHEKLALARERNNQLAHARAEYLAYLDRYPGGEGAMRVMRRLNRLVTQQVPGEHVSQASRDDAGESEWQHNGSLYQFYHRNTLDVDEAGSFTASSLISTNINYMARSINSPAPMEINFSATHLHDAERSDDDEARVNSMYVELTSANSLFDIRLGRQRHKYTALFNRFDGLEAGYRLSPDYKARLIFGYPVETSETVDDNRDKYFYSVALTLFPEQAGWTTNLYYLEQTADNVLDRQEIAVDTRHQDKQSATYSMIDYSLQYETLNLFYASFSKYYPDKSWLNIIANYRKNPFLTTTNALIGQLDASSIDDLLDTYTEDELEQLSLDRTASYRSLSAYYMHYLNSDMQISTDITASSISGTVASAGVEAFQETGNEYSYSLGLTRRNLFAENDTNIINLRRSNLASSNAWLLSASSRFRLDTNWLINPGLAYNTQDYNDGRVSTTIRPSLGVTNRLNRHWQLEMEVAWEDKKTDIPASAAIDETSTQFYAGYIYAF